MFNKVIMIGNLTRDIELRYLQSGTAVGVTSIAVNKKFKTSTGEIKDDTCFIDITFWGRTAEVANQYLKRGSKILIEGELKQDRWQDQQGQNRSKHSISVINMQMLDSRGDSSNQYNASNSLQNAQTPISNQRQTSSVENINIPNSKIPEIDINDDDIPF